MYPVEPPIGRGGISQDEFLIDDGGGNSGPPESEQGGADRRWELISASATDVRNILAGDYTCSRFFGENATLAFDALIRSFTIDRIQIRGTDSPNTAIQLSGNQSIVTVGNLTYRLFDSASINTQGAFFNVLTPLVAGFGCSITLAPSTGDPRSAGFDALA